MQTTDLTGKGTAPMHRARAARVPRPPQGSPLALQSAIGNRAVGGLLGRARRASPNAPAPIDAERPAGATAAADALPAGTTLADADRARVVADEKLGGGWTEADGRVISSGRVGGIDRILLEGISGRQAAQGTLSNVSEPGPGFASAVGPGRRGRRGRAVALVPRAMRQGGGGETVVVIHFHGVDVNDRMRGSAGMRALDGRPEDVSHFQLPQQVEASLATRPGSRVVVLMPIGITTQNERGSKNTAFGIGDVDSFVSDCFSRLAGVLPAGTTPGPVYLSAHSGGGFEIERMMSQPSRLPRRFGGLFAFESIHRHGDRWSRFARDRLDADLRALERLRTDGTARGRADDVFAAQLSHLRDSGFRFAAFGGNAYSERVRGVRRAILDWFADAANERRLRAATGGRAEILDQLWANYQANWFAGSTHMNALSHGANFGRVLASLPPVGSPAASAPAPPPAHAAPTARPQPPRAASPPAEKEHAGEPPPPVTPKSSRTGKRSAGASCAAPGTSLSYEHYQMSPVPVPVVKGRKVRKAPAESTAEVLRMADQDPVKWYDEFTSGFCFLGRPVVHPIHRLLAEHLRKVEGELARQHGGPDHDPAVAGEALGLTESIIGSRRKPTSASMSMHMFGLAIDVNYTANPFIGASANDVFGRAGELVHGRRAAWRAGMSFGQLSGLNATLVAYFGLVDVDEETLADKLAAAPEPWRGMTVREARAQIEHDWSAPVVREKVKGKWVVTDRGGLGPRWVRGRPAQLAVIRKTGFMNIRDELRRGLKLDWGGSYGDNMHFDMRNTPVGAKIQQKIREYRASVIDEEG